MNPRLKLALQLGTAALCVPSLLVAGAIDAVDTSLSDVWTSPQLLFRGVPFALSVLTCLCVRELARLIGSRIFNTPYSAGWVVPALSFVGTLGTLPDHTANKVTSRRAAFDAFLFELVAGIAVGLPLLLLGIHAADPLDHLAGPSTRSSIRQRSLLFVGALRVLKPDAEHVWLQPTGFAGWAALYILALNFLPIGRSAGGELLALVTGRFHLPISLAVGAAGMAYAALARDHTMAVWLLLVMIGGVRHPGVANESERLGAWRITAFVAALLWVVASLPVRPLSLALGSAALLSPP